MSICFGTRKKSEAKNNGFHFILLTVILKMYHICYI